MKKKILFLLLILTFISGCKKIDSYLFYNKDYYSIFNDKKKTYNIVKKKIYRSFFSVKEMKIDSFSSIYSELENSLKGRNSLFFLENFISPQLINRNNLNNNSKISLLTYDLNEEELIQNKNISTFNIQIASDLIRKKIIKLFKKYSEKTGFVDCGIITNPDYYISKKVVDGFNETQINILNSNGTDINKIKKWIRDNKCKIIILSSYNGNNFILNLEEDEFNNVIFIELITDYGIISNKIKYKIDIYWDKAFKYALESDNFKHFIKNEKNIGNYTYMAAGKNLVKIKKYRHKNIINSIQNGEKTNK